MRETARPPRHRANRRGDTWNAYAMVNGDLPALGSFSDLAGLGQPGGCPKTKPGANQRCQARLPCRLPDLLLKRPDRRLRVAGVPQAKRAKPFGAVPSSGGRDRPPMSPRQEAMLLRRACGMDYRTYCSEVPIGGGRVIECLRENGPSLSRQCRSALLSVRKGR